jgi:hypothetical protein
MMDQGETRDKMIPDDYQVPPEILLDQADKRDKMKKEDDHKRVPMEIQLAIRKLCKKKLFPAVLKYVAKKCPRFRGRPTSSRLFERLCLYKGSLEPSFSRKQQYDIYCLYDISSLPCITFCKFRAKQTIGAAIRISTVIGRDDYADRFKRIVQNCFTPDDYPVFDRVFASHYLK